VLYHNGISECTEVFNIKLEIALINLVNMFCDKQTMSRKACVNHYVLFPRQQKWGLNTYLYAPKDDYKHRMFWREMYSVEEAGKVVSSWPWVGPIPVTYTDKYVINKQKCTGVADCDCCNSALL
jgi:hypothetical protein